MVKKYVSETMIGILCFSLLTLPYNLPKITENQSRNIVDAYSSILYDNPFSSCFLFFNKNGIEVNLVSKDLRLTIPFILLTKDLESQPTGYLLKINHWLKNPLTVKSVPLFLFNRYLRI